MIKPQAEKDFRDYSMMVSQLQALCNVEQWDAELAKNGQVLIKVQSCYVLNLASNSVDGPYNNVTETPHKKIKIQRLKCTQNMI